MVAPKDRRPGMFEHNKIQELRREVRFLIKERDDERTKNKDLEAENIRLKSLIPLKTLILEE